MELVAVQPTGEQSLQLIFADGGTSPADLEANEAGLQFWKSVMDGKATAANFNICDYVTRKWDQQQNPNVPGGFMTSRPTHY
ncbi:MAG: hypothetical protein U1A27_05850 [Phycisphaerae bacterium]